MKPTIKSLQEEIVTLHKQVSEIPEIKICPECKEVKPLTAFNFSDNYGYGIISREYKHKHCKSCDETVNERNKAVSIAKEAPKKVIKWWGKGK